MVGWLPVCGKCLNKIVELLPCIACLTASFVLFLFCGEIHDLRSTNLANVRRTYLRVYRGKKLVSSQKKRDAFTHSLRFFVCEAKSTLCIVFD